jgi:predicted RNA-binding Zn-ribbon protein involved in translation (DUF1610 family)
MKKPNIIFWDLETLPNLDRVMKNLPGMSAYPGLTLKASHNSIICMGYKRLGDKKARCINAWDFKGWKKDVNDDYDICKASYDILKDADGMVTHNGRRFDVKFLNSRLAWHGLPTLPKIPHIDTCVLSKSNLFLFNNRLNTVAAHLGCELKMENGGWELWSRVLKRHKTSMKTMTKYCKQDVEVLEQVFLKLRPFATNIPNHNLFYGDPKTNFVCPSCGTDALIKHGTRISKTAVRQRYLCTSCGSTCSTKKKDEKPR